MCESLTETEVSLIPHFLIGRRVRRGVRFWRSNYCAVISLWNFQRFYYAAFTSKNDLIACLQCPLSLREAASCDHQFILNHGQSLRVVEVPETSEKPTRYNIICSIKYSNLEHSGSSGGSTGALYLNNIR